MLVWLVDGCMPTPVVLVEYSILNIVDTVGFLHVELIELKLMCSDSAQNAPTDTLGMGPRAGSGLPVVSPIIAGRTDAVNDVGWQMMQTDGMLPE